MGALPSALDFACLYCQSPAGRQCMTSNVKHCAPHTARLTRRSVWIQLGGEFVVRILKTDTQLRLTVDEKYVAISHCPDPEKVTLVRRLSDDHEPGCDVHTRSIEFVRLNTAPVGAGYDNAEGGTD